MSLHRYQYLFNIHRQVSAICYFAICYSAISGPYFKYANYMPYKRDGMYETRQVSLVLEACRETQYDCTIAIIV